MVGLTGITKAAGESHRSRLGSLASYGPHFAAGDAAANQIGNFRSSHHTLGAGPPAKLQGSRVFSSAQYARGLKVARWPGQNAHSSSLRKR